ncbi:MAG TPA: hypothetical protein VMK83_03835 [Gaiellaceae bacterium]|nr:hypothetical protein [Gaiellaceae bacterium]
MTFLSPLALTEGHPPWHRVSPHVVMTFGGFACRRSADRQRHAAFFVASLPVPSHSGHSSTMRSPRMGAGT